MPWHGQGPEPRSGEKNLETEEETGAGEAGEASRGQV